jgi:hypothetical protein
VWGSRPARKRCGVFENLVPRKGLEPFPNVRILYSGWPLPSAFDPLSDPFRMGEDPAISASPLVMRYRITGPL